jgi:hypothetical protein
MAKDIFTTHVKGHVKIIDKNTGEILLDKDNAIHAYNMGKAIARGLANEPNYQIYKVSLGNGGTTIDSNGDVIYNPPRVNPTDTDIYNETYSEIVDEAGPAPVGNSVVATYGTLPVTTSLVTTTITLTANEPSGQDYSDGGDGNDNMEDPFVFDELGLKTGDDLLLSHIIFSPIEKTANRELIITYTLTVSVV